MTSLALRALIEMIKNKNLAKITQIYHTIQLQRIKNTGVREVKL